MSVSPDVVERKGTGGDTDLGPPWRVIVLNDDHNTFEGVARSLAAVLPGVDHDEVDVFPWHRFFHGVVVGIHVLDAFWAVGSVVFLLKEKRDQLAFLGGALLFRFQSFLAETSRSRDQRRNCDS